MRRKSVAEFFSTIENFDESAIYSIDVTNRFRKNVKLCHSRNLDLELLESVIYTLAQGKQLEPKHFLHSLKGFESRQNEKIMECHIQPDWILVWIQNDTGLTLLLTDTGTHSDLF
ncbi:MAG: type II toxin-antitoxin system YafQ family toxin [Prevotellaceae bacterium]|nr:type II toxin-antitoxin system YafQ family toxin [Prevotellaceae bacterium]